MTEWHLEKLWQALHGKKPHMPHFLQEIHLSGIRGIKDLRVRFEYPVSVVAGGNGAGKSTVLSAAACAYKVPGAGVREFVPSTLFPDFRPAVGMRRDEMRKIALDYYYLTPAGIQSMRWGRRKAWNRSFFGRKDAEQPQRTLYLRTLRNPQVDRRALSLSRAKAPLEERQLTASQIAFAHKMLPFRYFEVVNLASGSRSMLFASQFGDVSYSELHMAAGEHAVLRLAQDIAQLDDALVLIDEVEAGLHPFAQELLMKQLQELALRRDLQVIVTSHSPVVLNCVPRLGRILLERDESGCVSVRPPYRDLIQDALYGRSRIHLNVLCEDRAAAGILHGLFDAFMPQVRLRKETVRIGRDTGADEFPAHVRAFRKFGMLGNLVLVLDGDTRERNLEQRIFNAAGRDDIPVLFLPGGESPEHWVWGRLQTSTDELAKVFHVDSAQLKTRIAALDQLFDVAADRPSEIAKYKLGELGEALQMDEADICHKVAYVEASRKDSNLQPLVEELQNILLRWREKL